MQSIAYPNMFTSSKTLTYSDHEATMSNLKLMLKSDRNSMFGDPYYGTNLKNTLFAQNNVVLKDLVIDEIYSSIQVFMPQVSLTRNDIQIYAIDNNLYATINAVNLIDHTNDLYNIALTEDGEY